MLFDDDGVLSKVGQNVTIEKVFKHPQFVQELEYDEGEYDYYDSFIQRWHVFDAAIIKLNSPLKFGIDVKPACLPEPKFSPEKSGKNAIDSGWGVKSDACLLDGDIEECKSDRILTQGNSHTNFGRL